MSSLTPDACALVGDVVLQFGPETCLSSSASHTPIVNQQEGLVVIVQAGGVPGCVLNIVLSRKAALNYIQEHREVSIRNPNCKIESYIHFPFALLFASNTSEHNIFNLNTECLYNLRVDQLLSVVHQAPGSDAQCDHLVEGDR